MTYLLPAPPPRLLLPAVCTRRPAALALDTVVCSDVMDYLRSLPDESVNCVVTSPPYWNLRDYGVPGQIGMEQTPAAFIGHLVEVFHEVKRVLRQDGVCWVNLGDSYANDTKWGGQTTGKHAAGLQGTTFIGRNRTNTDLPSKNLIGIPWRVAFALQDDGWYLRSDCIWAKPNPMPESVTDRPTKSHEYVFLLTKSERYWYDADAIREKWSDERNGDPGPAHSKYDEHQVHRRYLDRRFTAPQVSGRNARTVWTIATEPTPFAHFATFPQKLVERCILAGCPVGGVVLDPFMGSGTVGLVARRLGRHYVGCDLNPEYVSLANDRLSTPYVAPLYSLPLDPPAPRATQAALFEG